MSTTHRAAGRSGAGAGTALGRGAERLDQQLDHLVDRHRGQLAEPFQGPTEDHADQGRYRQFGPKRARSTRWSSRVAAIGSTRRRTSGLARPPGSHPRCPSG